MTIRRILFCDDDPDIRDIIALSLGLDPSFELKGCVSAAEVLATAAAWSPDLILLDVMMPGMDGPSALAMLHANACTQSIPVVFMTARTQAYECQRFISLGAVAVIAKPFDPMTLATLVGGYFSGEKPNAPGRDKFWLRFQEARGKLAAHRTDLGSAGDRLAALASLRDIARDLDAAVGVCGYCGLCELTAFSDAARRLERASSAALSGGDGHDAVTTALDRLLVEMAACSPAIPQGHATLVSNPYGSYRSDAVGARAEDRSDECF